MNAAGVTESATFKKPIRSWSDCSSEKEAEAFKKPLGKLSADASEFKPFKKPSPSGILTGKTDGSRNSCEVHFSYPAEEGSIP